MSQGFISKTNITTVDYPTLERERVHCYYRSSVRRRHRLRPVSRSDHSRHRRPTVLVDRRTSLAYRVEREATTVTTMKISLTSLSSLLDEPVNCTRISCRLPVVLSNGSQRAGEDKRTYSIGLDRHRVLTMLMARCFLELLCFFFVNDSER